MDSFKIIAPHNAAVTLINLPLLIPQTLIRVSILEIEIIKKKRKKKQQQQKQPTNLTPDSALYASR